MYRLDWHSLSENKTIGCYSVSVSLPYYSACVWWCLSRSRYLLAHLLLILSLTWPFLFSFSQKPNMNMACLLIYISFLRKINQTMYIQTMYYSTNFNIIIQHLLSKIIRRRYQNHTPYPFPILVNSRQSHHRRGCIIIQLRNHPFGRRRWNESSFDRLRILKMWWIKRVRVGCDLYSLCSRVCWSGVFYELTRNNDCLHGFRMRCTWMKLGRTGLLPWVKTNVKFRPYETRRRKNR